MGAASFGIFVSVLSGGALLAQTRTMALSTLTLSQVMHAFQCRTALDIPCGLGLPRDTVMTMAAAFSGLLLLVTVPVPPLAAALGAGPVGVKVPREIPHNAEGLPGNSGGTRGMAATWHAGRWGRFL